MKTIQSRLLQIFIIQIFAVGIVGVFSFTLYADAVNKYKTISDNMVSEYHLTATAFGLITEFNKLAVSSTPSSKTTEEVKIRDIKANINQIYATLDSSITDTSTRTAYVGLKNTIGALEDEVDAGVESIKAGGEQNTTAHYHKANLLYGFVKEDGNIFLSDELKHVTTIQGQVNRSKARDFQIGGIAYLLVIVSSLVYAIRISRIIVKPIDKLTSNAEQITQGNIDLAISPELLLRKDETGRLSNAFNLMLLKLKEKIHELNDEKDSVEHKVVERTHELHQEQAKLLASIQGLPTGFGFTDTKGTVVIQNKTLQAIFGLDKPATSLHELATKLQNFDLMATFKQVLEQKKLTEIGEVSMDAKILRVILGPVTVTEDGNQQVIGAVMLAEDVTEAKVTARSKDEFFSIASHELRTPLTAIKGNASMMIDFYPELINQDATFREMVFDIHAGSGRLIDIVRDFLDASRVEQGKMAYKFEAVSIDKIIESVFYEMRAVIREKQIYLNTNSKTLDVLPKIWADKDRVTQILYNLVGNAVKFTDKGGVTIDASKDSGFVKITVTDTGRGISLDNQKLLFHKFQQAGASLLTRDTTRGTGLGLYISKLFAKGMGGSVELERSEEGKGSSFTLKLPVATKEQSANTHATSNDQQTDTTTGLSAPAFTSTDK